MKTFKEELSELAREGFLTFEKNKPLSSCSSFRIGGEADFALYPRNPEGFCRAYTLSLQYEKNLRVMGACTNVLFPDEGYRGVILFTTDMNQVSQEGETLLADAGENLTALSVKAWKAGLSGLEFAYGIPGTVGGAVYMNAGAYGGEMKDVLEAVSYLTADGRWVDSEASELDFSYRHSAFEENGACILGAVLHLEKGDPDVIKARMNELMQKRIDKQPLDKPSAGSTFKRPAGAFAAALIDQCGLRGYRHGGAAVSDKHCGFVVNLGGATCADVLALCDEVRAIVKEKTGYDLEKEIRVVK